MRISRLLFSVALSSLAALPMRADAVTLHYDGLPFERFRSFGEPPELFDTDDRLEVTIDLPAPLGASFRGPATPTSFTMTAGGVTITELTATGTEFFFETDESGVIRVWYVSARIDAASDIITQLATVDLRPYEEDLGSHARITRCERPNPFVCDAVYWTQGLSAAPGLWSVVDEASIDVPAPGSLPLLLAAAIGLHVARPMKSSRR
jgi:hypothetical protein